MTTYFYKNLLIVDSKESVDELSNERSVEAAFKSPVGSSTSCDKQIKEIKSVW